ncbi:hypothetical protein F0562_011689 [Nyssa sinensis]|uniref:Uncharacterized protein n=1 Tax=Nyssa sinensis TaxID=561372 RepID=A0A5J4ZQ52_9ASTE|nr:hypothetical protein F0562_011689 [Nyssa sinensis]
MVELATSNPPSAYRPLNLDEDKAQYQIIACHPTVLVAEVELYWRQIELYGRLYAATPVDPVFILLPIFEEARMKGDDPGKFRRLDEIIFVDGYPGYQHLSSIAEKLMQVVCDFEEIGLMKFFRLNDSKVCQLKRTLPTLDENYAARDEKDTLADAVSILGEYLKDEPWLKLLCGNLKLDLQVAAKAPDIETLPAIESSPASFNPIQEKSGGDKKTTRSGRQTKKAKVEMYTRNIKEMFCRASRRGK